MTLARTKRQAPTAPAQETIQLQKPPDVIRSEGLTGTLAMIIPMFGSMGMMAVMALSANRSPRMLLMSGAFMVMMIGVAGINIYRQRVQHRDAVSGSRREYLAYISSMRDNARKVETQQREFNRWYLPNPSDLPLIVDEGTRIGERETTDDEFLLCRVGIADQPFATELVTGEVSALNEVDPVAESALVQFHKTYQVVEDLPLGISLDSVARVQITGSARDVRGLARAMVCQIAAFTRPKDVKIAILIRESSLDQWDWVKWLPHVASDRHEDALGAARMVVSDADDLIDLLPEGLIDRPRFAPGEGGVELPHVIIVNDGVPVPADHPVVTPDGVLGITIIDLPQSWDALVDPTTVRVAISNSAGSRTNMSLLQVGFEEVKASADWISVREAEAMARRLISSSSMALGQSLTSEADDAPGEASAEITDLLGLGDVHDLDTAVSWRPRANRDRLRVPIGLTPEHKTVYLDFKESAQQGMGPHGLIIGATGSGKSEVLRTIVLSLAMTHSSEDVNLVLIDFKGGATFNGMADLPHVAAIVTNLGDDLTLVDRMEDALRGEMARRQELLSKAGNFKNVQDYERARKLNRPELEPLPALIIVADEFSELLAEKPDFADLFVAIGRLGRSLQIHLLMSSQRLEEGKLRGLDSHLSYRIGLRTFSAQESRTVIGVPDAYELPPIPGVGYLKEDQSTMTRFRASYVSGPPPKRARTSLGELADGSDADVQVFDFVSTRVLRPEDATEPTDVVPETHAMSDDDAGAATLGDSGIAGVANTTFDIAVARLKGRGPEAHQVWLPPLDEPSTLDQLFGDLTVSRTLGLYSPRWRASGAFTIPVGDVDRPLEQRRDKLVINLDGSTGHLAILGGPQSGKSTLARTVVSALALTHTPLEIQIYVIDLGGGTFAGMRDLPHIAGVALRRDADRVRRMFQEVKSIVDNREQYFADHGIDSMATYRKLRAEGRADDGYGDVFFVVDGWQGLRADFEDIEAEFQNLMPRGLNFGLHVVGTALRWMNFRMAVKDMFGSRIELRLGDALDSEIDRKAAKNVPADRPGRGLGASKHHILGGVPRIDGVSSADDLSSGISDLVGAVKEAWTGPAGPKLRELPDRITIEQIRRMLAPDDRRVILGLNESRLEPFGVDFTKQDHFYFFGGQESGKSSTLRLIASEIQRVYTPKQAQIIVIDYRRALLGEIPDEYLMSYATTAAEAQGIVQQMAEYFKSRIPSSNVTPQQLRDRSWWTGAEAFFLVDDYDLVNASSGNPLAGLQPLLAQAHDVGLHVILTRRSGGASRGMFEPVMQTFNDLSVAGMLLPGSPDDGQLIGRLRPKQGNPGRAQFRSRDVPRETLQVAWVEPKL